MSIAGAIPAQTRVVHRIKARDISYETLQIEGAEAALRAIRRLHPDARVAAKIDCEGAEYAIIAALDAAGMLPEIDVLVIELHQGGGAEMQARLQRSGFTTSLEGLPSSEGLTLEMLRAAR